MQRQKTIAKWLAIILLLTAIVACYVAFSAILNNKTPVNPDIAGADSDNKGDDVTNPSDKDDQQPAPTYSVFPRSHETVGGLTVRHVGGEANDVFLDSLYFAGSRYVIFYSASTQYDVKDCGIHIANFASDSLLSVTQISLADESFVCASVVQNGILIITKNAAQTKLRLYDSACRLTAESSCGAYTSYKLYVTSSSIRLFAADDKYINALTVTNTLDVIRSNFVYPLNGCNIVYAASTTTADTVFVQLPQGIGALTFSATIGFKYHFEMLNCRLLQVLPIAVNGKPSFALLAKCDDGVKIASVDDSLNVTANYLFKDAKTACATMGENNNIYVIADGVQAIFCSHLELQSSQALQFDDALQALKQAAQDELTYTAVEGERGLLIVSSGLSHCVVSLAGSNASTLISLSGKNIKTARERAVNGVSKLSVIFEGSSQNNFGYMCFGANDVFYVTL